MPCEINIGFGGNVTTIDHKPGDIQQQRITVLEHQNKALKAEIDRLRNPTRVTIGRSPKPLPDNLVNVPLTAPATSSDNKDSNK